MNSKTDLYVKKKIDKIKNVKKSVNYSSFNPPFDVSSANFIVNNPIYEPSVNIIECTNSIQTDIYNHYYNKIIDTYMRSNNDGIIDKTRINHIIDWYKTKINIKYEKFIPIQKYVEIIPRNIFVCWKTKNLPEKMAVNVSQLKENHPGFDFYLFDDNDCLYFIRNHFDTEIVNAFLYLKPGAYKADLFRLCVLYIHGGIYIDIKYRCINEFKFDYLLDKEYLTLDLPSVFWKENTNGIYNGFMVSKPRNLFLFECIKTIVQNVNDKYYGVNSLFPTGPGLLGNIYFASCLLNEIGFMNKMNEFECVFHCNLKNIIINNTAILETYPEYRTEQKECYPNNYYYDLWNKKDIYNTEIEPITFIYDVLSYENSIPLNLFQTYHSKEEIPNEIKKYMELIREQNPEFRYHLYGDIDCEKFIQNNFDSTVTDAFRKLIPGAYKADLFRYCVLYKCGGIYLDIKYYGVNGFKMKYLIDKEYLVRDIESSGHGIYNAFMVTYPCNEILKKAIYQIVENVKNEYYGPNYFYPTGPLLLKPYFESIELELVHREVMDINQGKQYYISYKNGQNILHYNYMEYRNIQQLESKKHYAQLWREKNIYEKR